MGDWLVIVGAALAVISAAVMFSDLMELRAKRNDPEAVASLLAKGVVGNKWIRLGVQVLFTAGLVLISVGVVRGI